MVGVIGGLCAVGFAALSAILSDTYGRRRIVSLGFALTAPWSFAVFPLIETGHKLVFGVTIVVTYCLIGWCMGPLAALLPEIFDPEYRYTGAALSHTLGAIVGGALPPVVSPILLASYGGWAVSVMMGALGLVSLACVLALPETSGRTLV
jgi:MFS family permease